MSDDDKWPPPTEDNLRDMGKHLVYEVNEYRNAIQALPELRGAPEWNPRLETSLLHFRVLRAFFLGKKRTYADDVLALHYIADWNPTEATVFADTKDDIDKRIAHLSTRRLMENFDWPLHEMNIAIENLISQFKQLLSPERSGWFSKLVVKTVPATATLSGKTCRTDSESPSWIHMDKQDSAGRKR
jgi:hypothetical protein